MSKWKFGHGSNYFLVGNDMSGSKLYLATGQNLNNFYQLYADEDYLRFGKQSGGNWTECWRVALKSDLSQNIIAKTFNAQVTVKANEGYICDVPFTIPDGYEVLDVVDTYMKGTPASLSQQDIIEDKIRVYVQPFYGGTGGVYAKVLFKKKS